MARKLPAGVSTVQNWKKTRRIPAALQPFVLRRASELGLAVTPEDVMFPFPEDRPADLHREQDAAAHSAHADNARDALAPQR